MRYRHVNIRMRRRATLFMAVVVLAAGLFSGPVVSRADEVSDLKKSIEQKQQEI